jgi:hypothetical protein
MTQMPRLLFPYIALLSAAFSFAASAAEIREFDRKTLERLGNELIRVSQLPDRGATDAIRKRAVQTARAALEGRLFDVHYDYVVLNDPDGKRLLVYALGTISKENGVLLAGHFRVTVSPDGTKAERVDALSKSRASSGPFKPDAVGLFLIQLVSNKPVETLIYTAHLARKPVFVGTPDGKKWMVGEGKMQLIRSKPSEKN